MKRPTYQLMSSTLSAYLNCVESGNEEWEVRHRERLEDFEHHLPSGSGFDSGSRLDIERSRPDRLVITTSFHHMNDSGMYDGWSEHDVIVTPSLSYGFDVRVTGRNRNDIKEYIADAFSQVLED